MIEENSVAGKEAVTFPVIYRHPVGIELGAGIRAARPERGGLGLWILRRCAKHLAAGGLVELGLEVYDADCLQKPDGSKRGDVARIFRDLITDSHMALSAQVIDFIRLDLAEELDQTGRIGQVGKMQE